jgi:hypothetical protein
VWERGSVGAGERRLDVIITWLYHRHENVVSHTGFDSCMNYMMRVTDTHWEREQLLCVRVCSSMRLGTSECSVSC